MGLLTGNIAELAPTKMQVREGAELMMRTMEAMKGASEIPMTRMKVPSGGGKYFASDDDAAPPMQAVEGMSGWYMEDGEMIEHSCRTCPYNRMGSAGAGKKGKACKNIVKIMMLAEGQPLPVEIKVPVMSVSNFSRYMAREVIARGLGIWQVTTRMTIKEAVNGGGIKYGQIQFECTGRVDDNEIAALRAAVAPMLLPEAKGAEADE